MTHLVVKTMSEWLWAYLLNVAISTWMVQSLTRMPVYHTVQTRPHSPTTFLVYYNNYVDQCDKFCMPQAARSDTVVFVYFLSSFFWGGEALVEN